MEPVTLFIVAQFAYAVHIGPVQSSQTPSTTFDNTSHRVHCSRASHQELLSFSHILQRVRARSHRDVQQSRHTREQCVFPSASSTPVIDFAHSNGIEDHSNESANAHHNNSGVSSQHPLSTPLQPTPSLLTLQRSVESEPNTDVNVRCENSSEQSFLEHTYYREIPVQSATLADAVKPLDIQTTISMYPASTLSARVISRSPLFSDSDQDESTLNSFIKVARSKPRFSLFSVRCMQVVMVFCVLLNLTLLAALR